MTKKTTTVPVAPTTLHHFLAALVRASKNADAFAVRKYGILKKRKIQCVHSAVLRLSDAECELSKSSTTRCVRISTREQLDDFEREGLVLNHDTSVKRTQPVYLLVAHGISVCMHSGVIKDGYIMEYPQNMGDPLVILSGTTSTIIDLSRVESFSLKFPRVIATACNKVNYRCFFDNAFKERQ